MTITLAHCIEEELEALAAKVVVLAKSSDKNESDVWQWNDSKVTCKAEWRTAKNGRRTIYRVWFFNGRRSGWNDMRGRLRKAGIL